MQRCPFFPYLDEQPVTCVGIVRILPSLLILHPKKGKNTKYFQYIRGNPNERQPCSATRSKSWLRSYE
jgi:hypothetical protein